MARILVVDDDQKQHDILSVFLLAKGHQPASALDAQDFLRQARQQRPDLVILDIQMPAGGGPMVRKMMSEHPELAEIPVVICSGMREDLMKQWFPTHPKLRYHPKPVKLEVLGKQIDELLKP